MWSLGLKTVLNFVGLSSEPFQQTFTVLDKDI